MTMEVCNVGSQIDFSSFIFLAEDLFKYSLFFKQKSPVDSNYIFFFIFNCNSAKKKIIIHCLVGRSNI